MREKMKEVQGIIMTPATRKNYLKITFSPGLRRFGEGLTTLFHYWFTLVVWQEQSRRA